MNRYQKKSKRTSATITISLVTICAVALLTCRSEASKSDDQAKKNEPAQYKYLREDFLGSGHSVWIKSPIGRLSLLKLENGSERAVRFDHVFRAHDKFRIAVSSNRHGYLYILHRSPGGKSQVLWPPKETDGKKQLTVQSEIRRGKINVIPPKPGTFIFDLETGVEVFYIAISTKPEPPPFPPDGSFSDEPQPVPPELLLKTRKDQKVEIFVRGEHRADPTRGVIYDPGIEDPDPNIYFSANPSVDAVSIMFVFSLNHE